MTMELVRHNHVTRDIQAEGKCPACDEYWRHARTQMEQSRRNTLCICGQYIIRDGQPTGHDCGRA